ncbi:peptide ABC transporter substrate-binding protein [Opitutia bacterium ISCC 51]|nr:peptide ABC transporter substrate-binding protein [Opitutae bacterium ISCC 51]QXD26461.1 peptide ABC transporter substrate-binding protein [Opitutae bacterium ISCC 52]
MFRRPTILVFASLSLALSTACKKKTTPVENGIAQQILHVGNGLELQELDPHIITGISEIKTLSALFEGLVGQAPEDLSPVSGLASSWEVSDDGKTYTFHLREGLTWNNQTPLSARDFSFSFKRMLNPKLGAANAYLLFVLKNARSYFEGKVAWSEVGVRVENDRKLILELENPTPYFLRLLSHPAWYPVPEKVLSQFGDPLGRATGWTRAGNLVSSGAFQLVDWRINERLQLVRNPHYWDNDTTRLEEIYFYPTENREAEERAYRGGQLHITEAMPTSQVKHYRDKEDPALQIDPYLGTYYLQLNTRTKPLDDPRVRRALSLVINRNLITEKITQGGQQPAWHFTPPETAGYTVPMSGSENEAQAKRLLNEAGFPNGENFPKLTYLYNTSENHKAIAEAIQHTWQSSLGIQIELINQEWKVYTQSRESGEFDILRASWVADYEDPISFLDVMSSKSGNNFTGWTSPNYDQLLEQSHSSANQAVRYDLLGKAEELLVEEQPIIPLYFYTSVYLKHPAVKNYYPTLLNHHPWKHVYLGTEN